VVVIGSNLQSRSTTIASQQGAIFAATDRCNDLWIIATVAATMTPARPTVLADNVCSIQALLFNIVLQWIMYMVHCLLCLAYTHMLALFTCLFAILPTLWRTRGI